MSQETDFSRRDLFKTVGAVTAVAAAIEGAPAIQKVKAANDQVQYGMIGTGSRGTYLLKHLKSIPTGHCMALCDIQQVALDRGVQTIGNNPATYKDYHDLLDRKTNPMGGGFCVDELRANEWLLFYRRARRPNLRNRAPRRRHRHRRHV